MKSEDKMAYDVQSVGLCRVAGHCPVRLNMVVQLKIEKARA